MRQNMITRKLLSFGDSLPFLVGAALALSTLIASAAFPAGNLIVNGSGQSPAATGWTILASTGNGWGHSTSGGADDIPGHFMTSFSSFGNGGPPCKRSQTIDLLAAGATAAELDTCPPIRFSEYISCWGSNNGYVDLFYITVELRDANGTVLASWNQGAPTALAQTPASWTKFEHTFTGYPTGVRSIYVEDGGYDPGYWAGHYGSYHDAATLELIPDTDQDGLPDQWEIANGTNPNENGTAGETTPGAKNGLNGGAGDFDGDGLSNALEFAGGTRGNLKDTDGDGFWDSWENKAAFWESGTATGTDPLNPDTDRDGLPDGAENPDTGGTDPTLPDTDGDEAIDGVEVLNGSDPVDFASLPVFPAYSAVMSENFDGGSVNSTYAFTTNSGAYTAAVVPSGVAANGNVAGLTSSAVGGSNTSIAWNAVPANANSVRLSFDFLLTSGADGLGIGFFKTSGYGSTGGNNPGFNWEDPKVGPYQNAVMFGFRIYNANVLHITSPDKPTVDRFSNTAPFTLSSGVYHRAIITAYRAGAGTTAFNVDLIQDVNGAATSHRAASNIVAKDFDIATDAWRLIAGGRTGGVMTTARVDNIVVSSSGATVPVGDLKILSTTYIQSPPSLSLMWSSAPGALYTIEQSPSLAAGSWTPLQTGIPSSGTVTSYNIPLTVSSPNRKFYRVKDQ